MAGARTSAPHEVALVHLSVDECLALLTSAPLGRVALVVDDALQVVPVNFVLHLGTIVFRTAYGTLLDTVGAGATVAFEVDDYDAAMSVGWSVLVQGRAEEVWRPAELEAMRELPLQPWAPGDRAHYVRIAPAVIAGRRLVEEA